MTAELELADRPAARRRWTAARLFDNRQFLGWLFMLPAGSILLVFLAYPLGLGFWLGLTDTPIGEPGHFIGLANFVSLAHDSVFWLSVFNTIFYTVVASFFKFFLGLYLALLLNRRLPFKSLLRAIVLLPFVVPTVLSAIAFWWIYDPQFSIVSWALIQLGLIDHYIDFLGQPWHARFATDRGQRLARHSVRHDNVARGIADDFALALRSRDARRRDAWQRFRFVTLPLLSPIIAVVMTFSVLLTFTDFQLIYTLTRGGPINATHLMATLSFERAITGGHLGEGAAIADAMVPFLLAAILFSYFGLQRRRWQPGSRA